MFDSLWKPWGWIQKLVAGRVLDPCIAAVAAIRRGDWGKRYKHHMFATVNIARLIQMRRYKERTKYKVAALKK